MAQLTIRIADISDADQLLQWRNDPDTHRWYKNPTPVSKDDHLAWLTSQLSREPTTLWIAERGAERIGSIRLSEPIEGVVTVSVAVAPEARGQGIARALLAHIEREAKSLGYTELVAEIHEGNVESESLFRKAGYSLQSTGTFGTYVRSLQMPQVSVLLPVMNEVNSLNQTISIITEENPHHRFEFLIVLSQRSDEAAVENAYHLAQINTESVRVIVQEQPLLGGALMDAIADAHGNYILMMASDLETNPHAVHQMLQMSTDYPEAIITTTRWRGEGSGFEGYGLGKKWANHLFQKAVRGIFASELSDLTYGFRLYPADSLKDLEWKTFNHGFLLESILRPLKQGWSAKELPVTWTARKEGESNNSWKFYASYFKLAFSIRFGA